MKKSLIFGIVVLFAAVLFSAAAFATTTIPSCPYTISSSDGYVLTGNITSASGNCISTNSNINNVLLDCQGNTITYGTSSTGVGVYINSNNVNITVQNCTIVKGSASGNANYGIELFGSIASQNGPSFSTIVNNIIYTNGTSNNWGVYVGPGSNNNNITSNTIVTSGTSGSNYGIDIFCGANNNIISSNNISTSSSGAGSTADDGIYLQYSSGNTLLSNTISTNGNTSNAGFYINGNKGTCSSGGAGNNVIASNKITSSGVGNLNEGIFFTTGAANNNFSSNTISTNGISQNYGVYILTGSNNTFISSNNITTNGSLNNNAGIFILASYNNTVNSNMIFTNGNTTNHGIHVFNCSNNTFTSNSITTLASASQGIFINASSNNFFAGNQLNASDPTSMDWSTSGNSFNNAAINLTLVRNNITVSMIDFYGTSLKAVTAAEAAGLGSPSNQTNLDDFFNTTNNSANSWLFINISYTGASLAGINESTIGIWRYDGANWINTGFANAQGVDTANKFAYANISSFSTYGLFGEEYALAAPTDTFTSSLAINGSVDGNLSGGSSYSTNQAITFLNLTSGRKFLEVNANFSGANVDFSTLKIETATGKIAVDLSGVIGVYGTHTLWLPKTGSNGVYVCPNAVSVSEVSTGCSGVMTFAGAGTESGITVSVDGSYWKIENLTGSGAGEEEGGGGAVPEFSTITLLLALGVVAGGLILVRRKNN